MCASYNPHHEENDTVYSLDFATPARVFIFNNRNFKKEADFRGGSDKDVSRLCKLFSEIKFHVECFIDKTADQIGDRIRTISSIDYNNVGCVLIFIMSHGTDGKIFGTDGEEVHLNDFVDPFKTIKSLKDKPKMFFVNACRGNKMVPTHDHMKLVEMDAEEANEDLFKANKTPLDADFLFVYSTVANYYSIRDSENGSWFIEILCDMITKYKTQRDILGILTNVIREVKKKEGTNRKGNLIKMHPTYTSQLSKDFYFVSNKNM
jgi:hypothetical protein